MFNNIPKIWQFIMVLSILLTIILSSIGLTVLKPHLMIPDGLENSLRALHKITQHKFFQPVLKKGGNFHVNLLAVSYLPKYLYLNWIGSKDRIKNIYEYYVIGRLLSVLAAILTLLVTYKLTSKLFTIRTGALSVIYLTLSMGFIYHAHFATEDIIMTLFLLLSLYLLVSFHENLKLRYLYLGAAIGGLAVAAKASAGLLVLPYGWTVIYLSFTGQTTEKSSLLNRELNFRSFITKAGGALALLIGSYLIASPGLLIFPKQSLQSILREASFRWDYRQLKAPYSSFIIAQYYLARSLGLPLYLLSLGGLVYSLRQLYQQSKNTMLWAIQLFLLPYLAIISSWDAIGDWAVLPLLPLLLIFTGQFTDKLLKKPLLGKITGVILVVVIIFSAYYTLGGVIKFKRDSRIKATEWLKENLPAGTQVDGYSWQVYLPGFPERVKVRTAKILNGPTLPWLQLNKRLRKKKPEYIVLVSSQYSRYFRDPDAYPQITKTFHSLINEKQGYLIEKSFGPPIQTDYEPTVMLKKAVFPTAMHPINPTVIILRKK